MSGTARDAVLPRVVWVSGRPIGTALDSATWLETTRELRGQGWPISLMGEGPAGTHDVQGVKVQCLPKPDVYGLGYVLFHLRLWRFLFQQRTEYDAILFHQESAPWVLPLRFLRSIGGQHAPLLAMDTRDVVAIGKGLRNQMRRLFFRLAHGLANRWADGQTAITPRMAQLVGIPSAHLWGTWPSGVDLERFQPAQTGRQWPGAGQPIHLMYIGTFVRDRNLGLLCRAVERANLEGLALELSLVGDGPERRSLEEAASGAEGAIRVRPPVPHNQIPVLLRQVHVGVTSLPSAYDRKFEASSPIKLFEYMAAGLPVMATDNACHTDVVGEGAYAFWVREATEDGILAALRSLALAQESLGVKGAEAAVASHEWTWQQAGFKLGQALERGLARPAGGSDV